MATRPFGWLLVALGMLCASASVPAQAVYRIVGKDGTVTYSDMPPEKHGTRAGQSSQVLTQRGEAADTGPVVPLPYALAQVVQKFPVTLYTAKNCSACLSGRTFLTTRGIPFSERTVSNNEDIEALQKITGQNALPVLHVGEQVTVGFSEMAWAQDLDAAGYPKSSQLPANYQAPVPQPLVSLQNPGIEKAPITQDATKPAPVPGNKKQRNPAGIQF